MDLPDAVKQMQKQNPDCSFSQSIQSTTRIVNGQGESSETRDYFIQCPGERRKRIHSQTTNKSGGLDDFSMDFGGEHTGSDASTGLEGLPSVESFMRDFFGMRPGLDLRRFPFPLPVPERRLGPSHRRGAGGEEGDGDGSGTTGGQGRAGLLPAPPAQTTQPPPMQPSLAQRERGKGVLI